MEKKIQRWCEKGLIDKDTACKLLLDTKEQNEKNRKIGTQILLYTVGAYLLGMAVISFIAANDWLLKIFELFELLKIIVIFGITVGCFWWGYKFKYEKNSPKLGTSLLILSTLLIGATYSIIGQVYNFNASSSLIMFAWCFSIAPIAYLFKINSANILATINFIISTIYFFAEQEIGGFLIGAAYIPITTGVILYTIANIPKLKENFNDFSLTYKIAGLYMIFFTLMILICHAEMSNRTLDAILILPILILFTSNLILKLSQDVKEKLVEAETNVMIILQCLLFAMLSIENIPPLIIMVVAHILIIVIISYLYKYGYLFRKYKLVSMANFFLIIYIATAYFRYTWSYLNKTLIFLIGGIVLIGTAYYLEKRKNESIEKENKNG